LNSNPNGSLRNFSLDGTDGDDVWLVQVNPLTGSIVRFADDVHFGAAAPGESWGRIAQYPTHLVPLLRGSLGTVNGPPRVGPLLINELHYHPAAPSLAAKAIARTLSAEDLEYVEIYNPTSSTVSMAGWRIRGGVEFDFPSDATIAPKGTLVVTAFDPQSAENGRRAAALRTQYGLDEQVPLIGGFGGRLSDSMDRVELQRPGTPSDEDPASVPHYQEDSVIYDDQSPWPLQADGMGRSLHRFEDTSFGLAASSWRAFAPSPGSAELPGGDLNGDASVNEADIQMVCAAIQTGSLALDLDRSGAIDIADLRFFVEQVLGTSIGDTNLDGTFNSSDFVLVFQAGEYEDAFEENSTWSQGDWTCDGDFTTQDLVAAFQSGQFVTTATKANAQVAHIAAVNADFAAAIFRRAIDAAIEFAGEPSGNQQKKTLNASPAFRDSIMANWRREEELSWPDADLPSLLLAQHSRLWQATVDHPDDLLGEALATRDDPDWAGTTRIF
jgi:hypothetical protein